LGKLTHGDLKGRSDAETAVALQNRDRVGLDED
jgi:hypothetical protein